MTQVSPQSSPAPSSGSPGAPTQATETPKTVWRDLNLLTKPRIALMVVITAFIGFDAARMRTLSDPPGVFDLDASTFVCLLATLFGTALACMAAGVFNQVIERDLDAKMKRTADRPLPARRLGRPAALILGAIFTVLGVGTLYLFTNPLTAMLSVLTIVVYAVVYTPMKRYSSLCTIVGAFPGAMPPILGYTAFANRIDSPAWVLFGILFVWQLPHFLAIAWLYKDEYAQAGMPMLPVVDDDFKATSRQILVGCLALVPLGTMPTFIGMAGVVYLGGAFVMGLVFLGYGVLLVLRRTRAQARTLFFCSIIYLPVVFGLIMLDRKAPVRIMTFTIQQDAISQDAPPTSSPTNH